MPVMDITSCSRRTFVKLAAVLLALTATTLLAAPATPVEMAALYRTAVDRRLDVPQPEVQRYAQLTEVAFARAWIQPGAAQYVVVVDRDPQVQALLLMWRSAAGNYQLVGASPVSTGSPGSFDHFETPLGVFDHHVGNPDFRAEGTRNANGIRGYGAKGMRVFDLGWQRVAKGWGDGAFMEMRLQMHATDPEVLEQRLGSPQSKGCIRIPATLNQLVDHYGVLDAEYERLAREGRRLWVLHDDRDPVPDAGRFVVVVDSERGERPAWSPAPVLPHRRPLPTPPTRTSTARGVTVAVTPGTFDERASIWEFALAFHSTGARLDDDLPGGASLLAGLRMLHPIAWDGEGPTRSHHRVGVLKFLATSSLPEELELRVQRRGEPQPRIFRWSLGGWYAVNDPPRGATLSGN